MHAKSTIGIALVLMLTLTPLVAADPLEGTDQTDPPTDVPCYAVDWTTNPPSIYEVPCPSR